MAVDFGLQGQVAIVTGSTSGIGHALADALAAQGVNIVLNGLGEMTAIEKTRAELAEKHGVEVLYHGADMTKPDQIADMVATAHREFGRLDILLNNAGVQHVAPVDEFPPEKWDQIIAINLSSAFHTTRAAMKGMKASKWGRIINTASAHALVASPFKSAYVAAKHGIAGFTKTIALEGATFGITSNAICPGYVWTPLVEKQIPDTMAARGLTREQVINDVLLDAQPTKQFVTVEEIAALAIYLSGDLARSITGSIISIDGGWTAE